MSRFDNDFSVAPSGGDPGRSPGNGIQTDPSIDRRHGGSVEGYSRIMLEYTQRRMAGFADNTKGYATSRSSRIIDANNQSGDSKSSLLASQAAGHPLSKTRRDSSSGNTFGGSSAE
ncbi:uncharacterized protein BJX67DRAFT_262766 [Aspergillus lucknowensis]|uniref:Uncharacterized protein n=1 Tax=Aspergillus lucknowensis TaxID=176173 RepID=A0ABR4LG14_9EURO